MTDFGFMPHGTCFHWHQPLLMLHIFSDALITLSYFTIPFALIYFVYKRQDLSFRRVFILFGAFIFMCGASHLLDIWTIWHPSYWLVGFFKLATGLVSIATAIQLWRLMPELIKLPSPSALQASEAYMRAIFDASPDAMLISDEQGIITMVNERGISLLGYRPEQLIGQTVECLIPEALQDKHVQLRNEFIRNPSNRIVGMGLNVFAIKADNTEIEVDISLSTIRTAQGVLFASSLRDVTQQKRTEAALVASENRFRRMADASPAMIWITDKQGNASFVNKTWLDFTGQSLQESTTKSSWLELIHPEDREILVSAYYRDYTLHSPIVIEYRLRRGHEDWRWILDHGVPLFSDQGDFEGYIGSAIDITDRKLAEAEFRIAATAFESREAMVITDINKVILRVNKAFCDTTGYEASEAIGQNMNILKSDRHDQRFYQNMWNTINEQGSWQGEIWDKRKNGEIYPKWLTITAVKDVNDQVTHYVGTHIDISDRKAAEDEIKTLAFYDPLTKLPNRRLLRDRLRQAIALDNRMQMYGAVYFIDLDNFKTLNDTMGHGQGDRLLQLVAERLTSCVRDSDTVARLGGDEFVVMMEALSDSEWDAVHLVEMIGNKILHSLGESYDLGEFEHHCTASVGVTLFNGQVGEVDDILKQADIAMYQSKACGRNTLRFFDPSMQETINQRACLERELGKALENKEFQLYYQLQYNSDGLSVVGAEALIRWIHPQRGLVPPDEFIPVAEASTLIVSIGNWVLETACQQLLEWQQNPATRDWMLSINVSAHQFHMVDFVKTVKFMLSKYAFNPDLLKLELTESVVLDDVEDVVKKMHALKSLGVRLSLDDFGTGYSSLAYLKRLPFDQIKIDKSFVRDILLDPVDAVVVKTIIDMAKNFRMNVIAEGVENQEQFEFLKANGCMAYQGYWFCRPLPLDQLQLHIEGHKQG